MPAGNITTVEKIQRLSSIKEMIEDEKSDSQISKETGMNLASVKRNRKYLEELSVSDITTEERAERRSELYIELVDASKEAQELFEKYKNDDKATSAKMFFSSWLETIQLRMKLYGLEIHKADSFTQIQINNRYVEPDVINMRDGIKMASMIKKSHEKKLINEDD